MANENRVEIRIVASGAEQAARVLQSVAGAGAQIGSVVASGASGATDAMGKLGESAKRVFEIFTGVSLGTLFVDALQKVKALTTEMLTLGREARMQEESFRLVAESVGASSDALAAGLRRASDGLVNQSDTMLAAARGLQQGLQPEQLVKLMEIARAQAKLAGKDVTEAFNDIATAATNQQVRALKAYGIIIDANRAYEEHARRLGTVASALTEAGQSQAIVNAVLETMKGRLVDSSSEIIKQEEAVKRWQIAWRETKEQIGKGLAELTFSIVDNLKTIGAAIANSEWLARAKQNYVAFWDWVDKQTGARASVTLLPATPSAQVARAHPGAASAAATQQEIEALGVGLTTFTAATAKAIEQVDRVKDALFRVDAVMIQLTASYHTGRINAEQYAAGLGQQLAVLRAVPQPTQEIKDRIVALTTAYYDAVRAARAWDGAIALSNQRTRDVIVASENAFGALAAQTMKGRSELYQDDVEAFRSAEMDKVAAATATLDEFQILTSEQLRIVMEAWDLAGARVEKYRREVELARDAAQGQVELFPEDLVVGIVNATDAWSDWNAAVTESETYAAALGTALDTTSVQIANQQAKLRLLINEGLEPTGSAMREVTDEIARLQAQRFDQTMADIALQARLLGPDFDAVSAAIEETRRRLLELARQANADQGEIEALRVSLANLIDYKKTRDLFTDLFSSIGDTFQQMVSGILLGTQTIGEAFKRLGQNILVNFVNLIIQKALQPLVKAAAETVAGLLTVGASTGVAGATGGGGAAGAAMGTAGLGGGGGGTSLLESILGIVGSVGRSVGGNTISGLLGQMGNYFGLTGSMVSYAGPAFGGALTDASGALWDVTASARGLSSMFDGLMGSLGGVVGALGAAYGLYSLFSSIAAGTATPLSGAITGAGIGLGATVAIGAMAGIEFGPVGMIVGALIGAAAGALLSLFSNPGSYVKVRAEAAKKANDAINALTGAYLDAAKTGSLEAVQGALAGTWGERGAVRTELALPPEIAQQLGIAGFGTTETGLVRAAWSDLDADQFRRLVDMMREVPTLLQSIVGSGDIGYLNQADAEAVAAAAAQAGQALINAFLAFEEARKAIDEQIPKLTTGIRQILPADLAQAFIDATVTPLHAAMIAALQQGLSTEDLTTAFEGFDRTMQDLAATAQEAAAVLASAHDIALAAVAVLPADLAATISDQYLDPFRDRVAAILTGGGTREEMQADLAEIQQQANAISALITLYGTLHQEIVSFTGDAAAALEFALTSYAAQLQSLTDAITQAQGALAAASADHTLSLEEEAMLQAQIHDAVIARYTFEVETVKRIEAEIARLLQYATTLATVQGALAVFALQQGNAAPLQDMIERLRTLATTSSSVAVRLAAIESALTVIAASAETLVGTIATDMEPIEAVGRLTEGILGAARPFIDELGSLAATAEAGGDLEGALKIYQQQGEAISAMGSAAIAAVQRWGQAAIAASDAAYEAAVTMANASWDAVRAAAVEAHDATVESIKATAAEEIAAIETARDLAIDRDNKERDRLTEQIRLTQAWETALENVRSLMDDLLLGASSSLTVADRLLLAQERERTTMAAARELGTPEAVAAAQQAAEDVLTTASEALAGQPRAYQAVFEQVMADLRGLAGFTAGRIRTPSEILQEQLDALTMEIGALADAAQASIAASTSARDMELAAADARQEIALAEIEAGRQSELDMLRTAWEARTAAIQAAVDAEVEMIRASVVTALTANTERQAALLTTLITAQVDLLKTITGGLSVQDFMARKAAETVDMLRLIEADLAAYLRSLGLEPGGGGISIELPPLGSPENPWPVTPAPTGESTTGPGMFFPKSTPGVIRLQEGGIVTKSGLFHLERGEAVTPAAAPVTFTVAPGAIIVQGASNPAEDARRVVAAIERWARSQRGQAVMRGDY